MSGGPCLTCGGPLPTFGRMFFGCVVVGVIYGVVYYGLLSIDAKATARAHDKFKVDLLEAAKQGSTVVIDRGLAESGEALVIDPKGVG